MENKAVVEGAASETSTYRMAVVMLLGRAESEIPLLVQRRRDWTEAEYEEYTRMLEES